MTQSALADLLAAWLPAQRWFAGSGSKVGRIDIKSQVTLVDGEPELVHLMADAWVGQNPVSYQVPVGIRSSLPVGLTAARIGALPDGRIAYDAAADPEITAELLRGIAAGRIAGPLRFAAEPDAAIDVGAPARTLPALASNTSVVFGNQAILKLLRRPFVGDHPDLEVPAALARRGSKLVAAPLGWIELTGAGQSTPVVANTGQSSVLAILSVFFANSRDGWSLATASLHEPEPDFSSQARLLGEATARLHTELAAAFGSSALSSATLAGLVEAMAAELADAVDAVPDLTKHEDAVRACYESLTEPGNDVTVQRIHGDYHLAQVLGTDCAGNAGDDSAGTPGRVDHAGDRSESPRRWVVLDFEGEPSVPLARRRAFAPPLRDVAGMLRSFDYAARHEALRHPGDQRLADVATGWVRRCQDAFCAGYADIMGSDPRTSGPLLRALTLQKAVYEAVYEARHRPDWLPIPLAAIAEASR
ncbi:MAG TPA: aminoglycoside phosphotransferase [Streptosporangiaceae bacterium]|jgi:maltokinase|nr:aminoglycoside phosphotransferase [Streptosporangiaceae bacterium]